MKIYKKKTTRENWRILQGRPTRVLTTLHNEKRKTIYNPYKKQYELKEKRRILAEPGCPQVKFKRDLTTDSIWIGDTMHYNNMNGTVRIWSQNWNGIEKNDSRKFQYDLYEMQQKHIHYFSVIESTVNTGNKQFVQKLKDDFSIIYPDGELLLTNTPGYTSKSKSQPGGIASAYSGKLRTRIKSHGSDSLGRWHYHEFYGQDNFLKIYTIYRVNKGSDERDGETTSWQQQRYLLKQQGILEDPRDRAINDFIAEIQPLIEKGVQLIILGDFNEGIHDKEKTNTKFNEIGLKNVMQNRVRELPRTFIHGSKAIDHIYVTTKVSNAITNAGFAPFHFIKESDHRGMYIDLDYRQVLDDHIFMLPSPKQIRLKHTIPSRTKKYHEVIENMWESQNIDKRFRKVYDMFQDESNTLNNNNKFLILSVDLNLRHTWLLSYNLLHYVSPGTVVLCASRFFIK